MLFENIFIPAYFLFHFYEGNPRKTGKEYIFTLSQQTIIRNTSDKLYLKFAALYELCAATITPNSSLLTSLHLAFLKSPLARIPVSFYT